LIVKVDVLYLYEMRLSKIEKIDPTFRTLTYKKIFYNLLPQKDI